MRAVFFNVTDLYKSVTWDYIAYNKRQLKDPKPSGNAMGIERASRYALDFIHKMCDVCEARNQSWYLQLYDSAGKEVLRKEVYPHMSQLPK